MHKKKQKVLSKLVIENAQTQQTNQLLKKLWTFYGLLKVSKTKLKKGLNNINSNYFFIGFLPFIGYVFDNNITWSSSNHFNNYVKKTLPGLNTSILTHSKMTWETFNYTNVFKQLNWTHLKKINYLDDSIFLNFNSNVKFYNKQQYMGVYSSIASENTPVNSMQSDKIKNKSLHSKNFFLTGYNYHYFFFKNFQLKNPHSNVIHFLKLPSFKRLSYWHNFFSELDDIPSKLEGFFPCSSMLPLTSSLFLLNSDMEKNQRFDFLSENKMQKGINPFLKTQTKGQIEPKNLTKNETVFNSFRSNDSAHSNNLVNQNEYLDTTSNRDEALKKERTKKEKEVFKALKDSKKQLLFDFDETATWDFLNVNQFFPDLQKENKRENDIKQNEIIVNHLKQLEKIKLDCFEDLISSNCFKFKKINDLNLLPLTLVDYDEKETSVEQKNKKLNNAIYNKIKNPNLINLRAFYYQIYNSNHLFKNFISFQLNNFSKNREFSFKNFFNQRFPNEILNENKKGPLQNINPTTLALTDALASEQPLLGNPSLALTGRGGGNPPSAEFDDDGKKWQKYLRSDLRLLGNTNKTIQFNFKNATYFFPFINTYTSTINTGVSKTSILNTTGNDFILQKSLRNQKQTNQLKKKPSIIFYFQKNFVDHANKKLMFLDSDLPFSNVLSLGLNLSNGLSLDFNSSNLKKPAMTNPNLTNEFLSSEQQIMVKKIKMSIKQSQSDFINRKLSGYLYPDHDRDELIKKFQKLKSGGFQVWVSTDQISLQIQGPKNKMYEKFKLIANSQNKNLINAILCFNQNTHFKNTALKHNKTFFGAVDPDYHIQLTKTLNSSEFDDQSINRQQEKEEKKSKEKATYKPNLFINYVKKNFDSKFPFLFYLDPTKKQWESNNNPYYFSIIAAVNSDNSAILNALENQKQKDNSLVGNGIKFDEFKTLNVNSPVEVENIQEAKNIQEANTGNGENSSVTVGSLPLLFKHHAKFDTKNGIKTNLLEADEKHMILSNQRNARNAEIVQKMKSPVFQNKFDFDQLNDQNQFIYRSMIEPAKLNDLKKTPVIYKTYFNYTKQSHIPSTFKTFNTNLYEYVQIKKWTVLSQISFLLLIFNGFRNLQKDHQDTLKSAFENFFSNFELNSLLNLKHTHSPIVQSKKIKFKNLVGGSVLLEQLTATILLLKKAKKPFSKATIYQPNFLLLQKNSFKTFQFIEFLIFTNYYQSPYFEKGSNGLLKKWLLKSKLFDLISQMKNKHSTKQKQDKTNIEIPQGFLLIGPPGTGKTLLVKALAGEANVPIILESSQKSVSRGKKEDDFSDNVKEALQLKNLFYLAKKKSPCILFLDEIDTIGQNRKDVLTQCRRKTLKRASKSVDLLYLSKNTQQNLSTSLSDSIIQMDKKNQFNKNPGVNQLKLKQNEFYSNNWKVFNPTLIPNIIQSSKSAFVSDDQQQKFKTVQSKALSMLTQLLCELDGLKNRKDIIVIGATNRPSTLDPALIRPGRLNKIIYLDLPNKKKRFQLLKFYSTLGTNHDINWNFFANQTFGLSSAHLSSAMNLSALKTISYDLDVKKSIYFYSNVLKSFQTKYYLKNDNSEVSLTTERPLSVKARVGGTPLDGEGKGPIKAKDKIQFFSLLDNKTTKLPLEKQQEKKHLFFFNFFNKKPMHNFKTIEYGIQTVQSNFSFQTNNINQTKQSDYQTVQSLKLYAKGYQTNYLIFGKTVYVNLANLFIFKNHFLMDKTLNLLLPQYNNQLMNLFGFNTFSSYLFMKQYKCFKTKTLQSFIQKQNHLSSNKQQQRAKFYQKHKKYIRALYLLTNSCGKGAQAGVVPPGIVTSAQWQGLPKQPQQGNETQFSLFNKFITKLIKCHLFGCQLLINSTYGIKNPLLFSLTPFQFYQHFFLSKQSFSFFNSMTTEFNKKKKRFNDSSTNLQTTVLFNHQNVIKYKLLCSSNNGLLHQNFNKFQVSSRLFNDPYCLNRISYYLSGKALIFSLLKEKCTLSTLSLWSTIQSITTQKVPIKTYIKQLNQKLITKYQFENYLLMLISGKACEFLLLQNYQSTNYSNIGINELQQSGWLLRLMVEKHLFYKSFEISTLKFLNIVALKQASKNKIQSNNINNSFIDLMKSVDANTNGLNQIGQNLNKNIVQSKNISFWNDIYWWQIQIKNQYSNFYFKYGQWISFFDNEKKESFDCLTTLPTRFVHDSYFYNLMNYLVIFNNLYSPCLNRQGKGTKLNKNVSNDKILNKKREKTENLTAFYSSLTKSNLKKQKNKNSDLIKKHKINSINQQFLVGLLQNSEISWNTFQLNQLDLIMSNLLFDSFNKSFSILENNRELLDLFTYYLLCHERLYDFEIDTLSKMYFSKFEFD